MLARGLFLQIISNEDLNFAVSRVIQRFSVTRRASTFEEGMRMLGTELRWAAVIIEDKLLPADMDASLAALRGHAPELPILVLSTSHQKMYDELRIEVASPFMRETLASFARRALVLELRPDVHVASWVDQLSSDLHLTAREVQLLAYSLGGEPRKQVLKRLGVTSNTLKTQVRALLRKCGGRSMADLTARVANDARRWAERSLPVET